MIGIDGFACTVNPKRKLNGTTALLDAAAEPVGEAVAVPPGVHATTAAAAADMSA
jgi:hypothetical protein